MWLNKRIHAAIACCAGPGTWSSWGAAAQAHLSRSLGILDWDCDMSRGVGEIRFDCDVPAEAVAGNHRSPGEGPAGCSSRG